MQDLFNIIKNLKMSIINEWIYIRKLAFTCTFKQFNSDYQTKKNETFPCDQDSLEDKDRCLFHDENYLKDRNHPENKGRVI